MSEHSTAQLKPLVLSQLGIQSHVHAWLTGGPIVTCCSIVATCNTKFLKENNSWVGIRLESSACNSYLMICNAFCFFILILLS